MVSIEEAIIFYDELTPQYPLKEKEENEDESDTISHIFSKLPAKNDIFLEIFSHLPPQILVKFKILSKSFSNFTRHGYFIAKHSRFTGFFYQKKTCVQSKYLPDKGPVFVQIESDSEMGWLPDPSLKFLKQKDRGDAIEVIDSCNGLLLCHNTTIVGFVKTCFLCNPLTKENVALPRPSCRGSNRVHYALLAELTRSGYLDYKVLCLSRPKQGDHFSKLSILSSKTGEWEEFGETLPPVCHKTMMGSKVFVKGTLFWDCLEGHILICHMNVRRNRHCYELIEAPPALLGRCLWKRQNELRCYCHGFPDEFPAWSLDIKDFIYNRNSKWKIEGSDEFRTLTEDICRVAEKWVITRKVKPLIRFKIIAYVPESKKLFLFIPDSIYSYQFTTGRLKFVGAGLRTLKFQSPSRVFPYVYSLVRIQTGEIAEDEEEEEVNNGGTNLNPTDSFVELVAAYEKLGNRVKSSRKTGARRQGS